MKNFIKYLFPIYFSLLAVRSFSQTNLVPNPSFEDTVHCPNNAGQINYATFWINPTMASPDYMNICNTGMFGVPSNYAGTQNVHTGNAYALIATYGSVAFTSNSYREYIQVPLTSLLIQGEIYCVEFYVSLANGQYTEYAVNNIGAYFSPLAVSSTNYDPLPYVPQIVNPSSNPLTNIGVWTKVSGMFIAQGGEHYLTIGNFNNNAASDTVFIKPTSASDKSSGYYIDDVSVIACASGINELSTENEITIFPNPATNMLNIAIHSLQGQTGTIAIFDLTGKLVITYHLDGSTDINQVSTASLSSGLYIYKINVNDATVKNGKLSIIR